MVYWGDMEEAQGLTGAQGRGSEVGGGLARGEAGIYTIGFGKCYRSESRILGWRM